MKIAIIGTTSYQDKMLKHKRFLEQFGGHQVRVPAFDNAPDLDALGVCEHNREMIEWADTVHLLWDQRSTGSIFDFGMVFALRKPFKIIYMEQKTFRGVMEKYEKAWMGSHV